MARFLASRSRAVLVLTTRCQLHHTLQEGYLPKYETSAICTLTLNVPSSIFWMSRASSRSLAVAGSMVKTRLSLRSSRTSYSRSGILLVSSDRPPLCTTHLQGRGGRHLMASSLNSSVGKLQSLSRALVSTSASPIGPSSSTRVPKGCKEVLLISFALIFGGTIKAYIGHRLMVATNNLSE